MKIRSLILFIALCGANATSFASEPVALDPIVVKQHRFFIRKILGNRKNKVKPAA